MIDNIVDNVENLRVRYYLDISGPGLLGKSVNEICGRNEHGEFELGINEINGYTFKVLKHDWQTKYFTYDDSISTSFFAYLDAGYIYMDLEYFHKKCQYYRYILGFWFCCGKYILVPPITHD